MNSLLSKSSIGRRGIGFQDGDGYKIKPIKLYVAKQEVKKVKAKFKPKEENEV